VQDASFRIARGEVFVIMGLSGSGKSTLLRCLTRLIEPTGGEIRYDGEDVLKLGDKALVEIRRRRMGMVFQHFALLPNRTVLGNVAFPLEVQGTPRADAEARALKLIETVGLGGREARFPAELSGGQQQRVGIARSLTTNPEFWFLDEPFSALDPLIRADLQAEVLRLQQTHTRTVVFVTHDLDEAIRIADRIAIMEGGRIVQIGTPEELVTQPATDYVRRFVAKVSPARVVRVSSLMGPAEGGGVTAGVKADATISEIASELVSATGPLPVLNAAGRQIGSLDHRRALATLAAGA
jgi:glycine betaine/proline transport system ATP-binding protein